jgi:hypothetical protein
MYSHCICSPKTGITFFILLEGLPKPGTPYCGPATNQPLAEELKYSRDGAWRCQCPTNNMLEVWQNLASFGSRQIGGAVEALLTKVVSGRSSELLIVVFFIAAAVSISRPNGYSQRDALRV